jgi:hypothetical protein
MRFYGLQHNVIAHVNDGLSKVNFAQYEDIVEDTTVRQLKRKPSTVVPNATPPRHLAGLTVNGSQLTRKRRGAAQLSSVQPGEGTAGEGGGSTTIKVSQ